MKDTYERPENADERIRSAIAVIEMLLSLDICPKMKRKFLSNCLWQITQAQGRTKYDLRYRSAEARKAKKKELRHEHVTRRKLLVKELLANPQNAKEIAAKAIGCVVTKAEHKELNRIDKDHEDLDWWDRYKAAGIEVWDMVGDAPFVFPKPESQP
jgi:hypothetical protein